MRFTAPSWLRALLVPLIVGLVVALGYANYRFVLQAPGGNDFLPRWLGARVWVVEGGNPYDREVSVAAQTMIYGRPANLEAGEDLAHFVYPLPAMLFFVPFGLFSFPVARAMWMTLLELALPALAMLGILIARWRPRPLLLTLLVLFSVLWYHGLRSVVVGQFAVIEALLMIGALLAIQRDQDAWAGVLLGLSIAKPQMPFLLIPFVLLWAVSRRRWLLILSSLATFAILMGGSLAIMPDWPMRWLRQVFEYPRYTELGSPISILGGVLPGLEPWFTRALTALMLLYMFWEWRLAWEKEDAWFQWTAAVTIVITNWVAFRTATTNYVVMLPALYLVFAVWSRRWGKAGDLAVVVALVVLGLGLWWLFLTTVRGNTESPWMYIPLPAVALAGLWWVRWYVVRSDRLPI